MTRHVEEYRNRRSTPIIPYPQRRSGFYLYTQCKIINFPRIYPFLKNIKNKCQSLNNFIFPSLPKSLYFLAVFLSSYRDFSTVQQTRECLFNVSHFHRISTLTVPHTHCTRSICQIFCMLTGKMEITSLTIRE